jgi:antitoxin component YwqK of YwqJK toxin-antitoxin module
MVNINIYYYEDGTLLEHCYYENGLESGEHKG